jgi:hypothetical protein
MWVEGAAPDVLIGEIEASHKAWICAIDRPHRSTVPIRLRVG